MALCVFATTGFLHFFDTQYPTTAALLPGSSGGHPLFDSLPSVSFDGIVLETCPANLSCALELWTPSSELPHPSENPDPFVQHVQSAFMAGKGLHAIATVAVPSSDDSFRDITTGIDTLSDVNLATRDLLFGVHRVDADDVRGTGGTTTFGEQGYLRVLVNGVSIEIPALVADARRLPRG
jgi:hypothetical protein